MRRFVVSVFALLALALASFPPEAAQADQWDYPYTLGSNVAFWYNMQSSVQGYMAGPIQNAMSGWNNISARRWGGPYRLAQGNSFPGAPGQIVEVYSNWTNTVYYKCNSLGYAACTYFPPPSGGIISNITTWLNSDPGGCSSQTFTFNTGTVSSSCSISLQDLMVHELGFSVSLYEGCYPANAMTAYDDTTQNSVMCDYTLSQNHWNPQSNDILAVQYMYG